MSDIYTGEGRGRRLGRDEEEPWGSAEAGEQHSSLLTPHSPAGRDKKAVLWGNLKGYLWLVT